MKTDPVSSGRQFWNTLGPLGRIIGPRWSRIIRHYNFKLSSAVGALCLIFYFPVRLPAPSRSVHVVDVVGSLIGITGFTFAVAITVVAVVLALPVGRPMALMVLNSEGVPQVRVDDFGGQLIVANDVEERILDVIRRPESSLRTRYLDLVFQFVWTAVVGLAASAWAFACLVFFGNEPVLSTELGACKFGLSVGALLFSLALLQMVSSLNSSYTLAKLIQADYRRAILAATTRSRGSSGLVSP